jgi:hypothetical protein
MTPEQQKYQNDLDETYKAANKKIPPKSRAILGRPRGRRQALLLPRRSSHKPGNGA